MLGNSKTSVYHTCTKQYTQSSDYKPPVNAARSQEEFVRMEFDNGN